MFKVFIISLLFFFLNACSSGKVAGVFYHNSFDFSAVNSYSLYDHNSAFSETQGLLDNRRNAIEIAIERTMAKKNFSYAEVEQADVIVTYYVFDGRRSDYSDYNKIVHFCTPCLRATTWQTSSQNSSVNQGDLVLDIVNPKNNRSVWRSIYPLNLKETDNSAKNNEKIKQAITTMLSHYPSPNIVHKPVN